MVYDKLYSLISDLIGSEIPALKAPITFKGGDNFPGVIISPIGMNTIQIRQVQEGQALEMDLLVCPESRQVIPLSYRDSEILRWTYQGKKFCWNDHRTMTLFLLGFLEVLSGYNKKELPEDSGKNRTGS